METVTDGSTDTGGSGETDAGGGPDPETARRWIRERGETIRRREQRRAIRRLRERRSLSERERRAVEDLAESLTEALLSLPESRLRAVESEE